MFGERFRVDPSNFRLCEIDPAYCADYTKKTAAAKLRADIEELAELQDRFYAYDRYALLIIFQAMDAAGKDSTIKHVMTGINPAGCTVHSFKAPTPEELDHDFMWRCIRRLPARGMMGIFNRSYYEEVLIVRVHPEILHAQQLPPELVTKHIWEERYRDINRFERYLSRNGTRILKFFLHISKEEQKRRFLERIEDPAKNWKFSSSDLKERELWDEYQAAYEETLRNTSTEWAPWYVVPADRKWFARLVVANIIVQTLREINPQYPAVTEEQRQQLAEAKALLERRDAD